MARLTDDGVVIFDTLDEYIGFMEAKGYVDVSECPECGDVIGRRPEWKRVVCFNYGGCELSAG